MSQTANSNKILEYIADIIHCKRNYDGQGILALQLEGREKVVTLEEVGFTFISVMEDFTHFVDASQGLMEVRLKAVVDSLDEDTKQRIYKEFAEAEDDLLTNNHVEETNKNGKDN